MIASCSANANQGDASPLKKHAHTLSNSERIRKKFGSYGIEVLENDSGIRVSSLYSTHGGERINRTFAVVAYPDVIEPAFREEHDAIVKGQSIGTVFENSGWDIEKHHQYFGETETPQDHFSVSSHAGDTRMARSAIHVYTLVVKKGDSSFQYASIAEIHHPEFLQLEDLAAIYGLEFENHQVEQNKLGDFLNIVKSRLMSL